VINRMNQVRLKFTIWVLRKWKGTSLRFCLCDAHHLVSVLYR